MALNKKFVKMRKDKRAEMGVGTMIIFIAMVLVAAVAASVLIGTANQVREQAQSTGDQAINNVASGFIVQDVVGTVSSDRTEVEEVVVYLRLAAGSPRINMANVMITVVSGNVNQVMSMHAGDSIDAWKHVYSPLVDASPAKENFGIEADTGYLTNGKSGSEKVYYYYLDGEVNKHVKLTSEIWDEVDPEDLTSSGDPDNEVTLKAGGEDYKLLTRAQNSGVTTTYYTERVQATDINIPWNDANYVVAQGDLIAIHIVVEDVKKIGFSQDGVIKVMPAYGQTNQVNFKTPESFSTGFVTL